MRKRLIFLTASLLTLQSLNAVDGPAQAISYTASGNEEITDIRIARLGLETGTSECSTVHIGNGLWLTAKHCMDGEWAPQDFFVKTIDGKLHRTSKVYLFSPHVDLLTLSVPTTKEFPAYPVYPVTLNKGDTLDLIGYGMNRTVPTKSSVEITSVAAGQDGMLVISRSQGPSRSCSEDSGAPLVSNGLLRAIHVQGVPNPTCSDRQGSLMGHIDLGFVSEQLDKLKHSHEYSPSSTALSFHSS